MNKSDRMILAIVFRSIINILTAILGMVEKIGNGSGNMYKNQMGLNKEITDTLEKWKEVE